MLRAYTPNEKAYESLRAHYKRKCVKELRLQLEIHTDNVTTMALSERCRDVIVCMTALGYSPYSVAQFVGNKAFSEHTVLFILERCIADALTNLKEHLNGPIRN